MRKLLISAVAALTLLPMAGCGQKSATSTPFHSDLTGGDIHWVYWPGKKGSVAMWLVPVNGQEPIITMTCVKDGWKMNVRGYVFQSYQGQSGPTMFMTVEAGGLSKRSRLSWAPTGDTPIAQSDVRVTAADLKTMAAAEKIAFAVDSEQLTFNGFGKAGHAFPEACAKALGVS